MAKQPSLASDQVPIIYRLIKAVETSAPRVKLKAKLQTLRGERGIPNFNLEG